MSHQAKVAGRTTNHPWRCGDRRDHPLHQYVQPVCAGRRGPCRAQGAGAWPDAEARVKTSLAPGSQVVTEYLDKSELTATSTPWASRPLATAARPVSVIPARWMMRSRMLSRTNKLVAVSVLSGNRNFEGRVHPNVRANYWLARRWWSLTRSSATCARTSRRPPWARARMEPIYLKDIWPTNEEINDIVHRS